MSRSVLAYLIPTGHRRLNELVGLLLATVAILIGLSLVSFNPDDPSFSLSSNPVFDSRPANFIGVVGSYLADILFQTFGFASFLLPLFLGVYAFYWLASWNVGSLPFRLAGMSLMLVTLCSVLSVTPWLPRGRGEIPLGGGLGQIVAGSLDSMVNPVGTALILMTAFLLSLFLSTTFSFAWAMSAIQPHLGFIESWVDRYHDWKAERTRAAIRRKGEARKTAHEPAQEIKGPQAGRKETGRPAHNGTFPAVAAGERARASRNAGPAESGATPGARVPIAERPTPITIRPDPPPREAGSFEADLPSPTILNLPAAQAQVNEQEVRQRAVLIEEKAGEFEVQGTVQQIHPGPVVTTFEFKPEPGIKYSKVTGLGDDLCLALEAESVRIDRIPGKSTVGIEVPNNERATIVLREILESSEYLQSNYLLPLALGKDITGRIVVSDLQKMPHLLAAGSTGTGKSVSLNAMILSLLFRARPEHMKMILIDPKRLELGLYQDIPHLLVPVVTEPKMAQNALRWAVTEMETRYKKLARRGVRNLETYNSQVRQLPIPGFSEDDGEAEDRNPLPYIVIVIDELADLMMTAARDVEESITRLAQMARAVGIHLVLATQRPSVDVITGLIKANFPARVSFRVASKVDSRTLLDANGAEQLLGRGDMLFQPTGSSRLIRVHAPLVTEEEVMRTVEILKKQGPPSYNQQILEAPEEKVEVGESDGELDALYDDAVRIVMDMGKASTSALQRRLRVGYGRAASLLDAMERAGIIGPPEGSKPRVLLVKKAEYYHEEEE